MHPAPCAGISAEGRELTFKRSGREAGRGTPASTAGTSSQFQIALKNSSSGCIIAPSPPSALTFRVLSACHKCQQLMPSIK